MKIGIACLVGAYVLSQFYRAFLAVLSPALQADLGATPGDLAWASGLWFLAFAAMQIPVGAWLDRLGPRRTASAILGLAGGAPVPLDYLSKHWLDVPRFLAAGAAIATYTTTLAMLAASFTTRRAYASVFLVGFLMASLGKLQSAGNLDLQNAVGRPGKVYLRIPASRAGHGKVTVEVQGRSIEVEAVTPGAAPPPRIPGAAMPAPGRPGRSPTGSPPGSRSTWPTGSA